MDIRRPLEKPKALKEKREKIEPLRKAISARIFNAAFLHSDGTVTCLGDNKYGMCDEMPAWQGISAISKMSNLGLHFDGTIAVTRGGQRTGKGAVVATGNSDYGQCNVSLMEKFYSKCIKVSQRYCET